MIEYIINKQNQAVIYQTEQIIIKDKPQLSVIKQLCLDYLFTYEGYLKAVKKRLNYRYRIPLYINEGLQLIATQRVRDYDNIWINYASIKSISYKGNRVSVRFTSNRNLDLSLTQAAFHKQIERLQAIKFHISKHFHL